MMDGGRFAFPFLHACRQDWGSRKKEEPSGFGDEAHSHISTGRGTLCTCISPGFHAFGMYFCRLFTNGNAERANYPSLFPPPPSVSPLGLTQRRRGRNRNGMAEVITAENRWVGVLQRECERERDGKPFLIACHIFRARGW